MDPTSCKDWSPPDDTRFGSSRKLKRQGSSISSPAFTAFFTSVSAALPGLQHIGALLPFIAHQSVRTNP